MKPDIVAEGKYLRLVRAGTWEYVERTLASGVVVIVPFVSDEELLFVEQYRPAMSANCIEFPAGLAGDHADVQGEELISAARRELVEETGFEAAAWRSLGTTSPSAGLTSETMTFFEARGLRRSSDGGGVDGEQITVHCVPAADVHDWLAEQSQRASIAMMVYAGLYLVGK